MLASSTVIKQTARTALSGRYITAVITTGIFVFAYVATFLATVLLAQTVSTAAYIVMLALIGFFLLFPLALGYLLFCRRMLWGHNDKPVIIFKYFSCAKEYKRAIHLAMLLVLRISVATIIFLIPSAVITILTNASFYDLFGMSPPVWSSNLWVINFFLRTVALVLVFVVNIRYYMAPFLMVADENMDAAEAVAMSSIISKKTTGDFFWLCVSMGGWIILSAFLAPVVFVLPYMVCVYGVHCRFAVAAYNKTADAMNSTATPYFEG